jgi:type VI secretion system protein ImpL
MQILHALLRRPFSAGTNPSLRSSFEATVAQLRSACRNQRGCTELPWYLLMGRTGAGKSSLLQGSSAGTWRKIGSHREPEGDRGCDWWFTGRAVVVDINGRYLMPDDNHDNTRWQGFTELLQRYRKPQAINAAILLVSADDLLHADDEDRQRHARQLQQQLEDLQIRRARRVPCYLVISKCDLLAGFSDYFSALSPDERRQVWGITLPADAGNEQVAQQLQALHTTLGAMLPQRLQSERDAASRRGMAGFPLQFQQLQSHASQFVAAVFADSRVDHSPALRGVYFSGAANARYFSDSLFGDVIHPDVAAVAAQTKPRGAFAFQHAGVAAIATATVIALGSWVTAFALQQRDIDAAGVLLHRSESTLANKKAPLALPQAGDAISLLQRAEALASQHDRGWIASLGMRERSLSTAIRTAHDRTLEQQWLPALADAVLRNLLASDDDAAQFNALKTWLMLTDPLHRDINYLMRWFDTSAAFDETTRTSIQSGLHRLYQHNPDFAVPYAHTSAVSQLQRKLRSITSQERIYNIIRSRYQGQSLALKPQLGPRADSVFVIDDPSLWNIPALYTAATYRALKFDADMPELIEVEREQWVLGNTMQPPGRRQRQQLALDVQRRYQQDYANHWNHLLNALSLRKAGTPALLLGLLQPLSDAETSPLNALLRIAGEQTRVLEGSYPTLSVTPAKAAILSSTLGELRGWLNGVYRSDDIGDAALNTMAAGSEHLDPPRNTQVFSEELPAPVSQWIATLARTAADSIAGTASGSLETAWREQVADFCRANIGNHYPFAQTARRAALYNNFADYFAAGGIEDSFVRTRLGTDIDRSSWTPKPGAAIRLSATVLQMMKRAQMIRQAFFTTPDGGFSFRVTPVRMSAGLQQFAIDAGSTRLQYSHGPRLATQFLWPQDADAISTHFTSLNGSTVTRNFSGVWALYRMMDTATPVTHGDRLLLREGTQEVELALVPARISSQRGFATRKDTPGARLDATAANPLQRELLLGYRCIDRLR